MYLCTLRNLLEVWLYTSLEFNQSMVSFIGFIVFTLLLKILLLGFRADADEQAVSLKGIFYVKGDVSVPLSL